MWGCGLKFNQGVSGSGYRGVTPYVGVWIEIDSTNLLLS